MKTTAATDDLNLEPAERAPVQAAAAALLAHDRALAAIKAAA